MHKSCIKNPSLRLMSLKGAVKISGFFRNPKDLQISDPASALVPPVQRFTHLKRKSKITLRHKPAFQPQRLLIFDWRRHLAESKPIDG